MATLLAALALTSISLSVEQSGGLSSTQIELAISEMQQIWRDCGVTLTPRGPGLLPAVGEAAISLRVVGFTLPRNTRGEPILAWVAAEPSGAPAPVVFASLPTILAALASVEFAGLPFTKLTDNLAGRLVARAVGRVSAHELGHYLLQRGGHEARGLMRPSYTARDLVGAWLVPFQVAKADRPSFLAEIAALADARHGLQPQEESMAPSADAPNSPTSVPKVPPLALLAFMLLADSSDPAIARALDLLGDAAPLVPTVVVHTARPVAMVSVATAWTDGQTIFVNDQSEPYKHGMKNAIALAAALMHEGVHVVNGPAEAPAYAEQLRVMRKLGAKKGAIEAVERGLRAAELAVSTRSGMSSRVPLI